MGTFETVLLLLVGTTVGASVVILRYVQFAKERARYPDAVRMADLEPKVDALQARADELQAQIADREALLAERNAVNADLVQIRQRSLEERRVLDGLQEELIKMQAERAQQELIRGEVASLTGQKADLFAAVGALQAQQVDLAKGVATLQGAAQGAKDDVLRQADRLKQLDAEVAQRTSELTALQGDILKLKSERQQADADAKKAAADLLKVTAELAEARKQVEKARQELVEAQAGMRELEVKVESLRKEEKVLVDSIEALKAHLKNLRDDTGSAGDPTDRYADLWQDIAFPNLRPPERAAEAARLEATQTYIRNTGLVYSERVVRSFHVALKSADLSPLVVLAGISGTGKSELPKRYAEGMGMYFTSLAVQPRWDSPQDLFGFYNHLEKRYKSTPLARAMAQFERHNRGNWPMPEGWDRTHDNSDRMLLVLLDEMNLARIEYYFSDFLSRLETRRGIRDLEDPVQRAKAEIEIDMGSLAADEQPIRFYPDRNVLFTGTMNEDESTQSLSDRVLDRACVLRFGRPNNLKAIQAAQAAQSSVALGLEQWMGWCGDVTATPAMVDDVISKLNDSMEMLQRPFAHRVASAIRTYVANYRKLQANSEKVALADQIEQRILPKLRGVDIQENEQALQGIAQVIRQTEDADLARAFEESKATGTFLWKGVDRS